MSMKRMQRFIAVGVTLALASAVVAGCGQSGEDDNDGDGGSAKKTDGPKVGLVTDIGGLNDRSFNFLANKGFEQAEEELGAPVA